MDEKKKIYREYLMCLKALLSLIIQFGAYYEYVKIKLDLSKKYSKKWIDYNIVNIDLNVTSIDDFINKENVIMDKLVNIDNEILDFDSNLLEYQCTILKKIILTLVKKHYVSSITTNYADILKLDYDKEKESYKIQNSEDRYINVYYNLCESAGENSWKVLGFEEDFISKKQIEQYDEGLNKKLEVGFNKKGRVRS